MFWILEPGAIQISERTTRPLQARKEKVRETRGYADTPLVLFLPCCICTCKRILGSLSSALTKPISYNSLVDASIPRSPAWQHANDDEDVLNKMQNPLSLLVCAVSSHVRTKCRTQSGVRFRRLGWCWSMLPWVYHQGNVASRKDAFDSKMPTAFGPLQRHVLGLFRKKKNFLHSKNVPTRNTNLTKTFRHRVFVWL